MVLAVLPEKPVYDDLEIWQQCVRWGVLVPNWLISTHGRLQNVKTGIIKKDDPRIRNSNKGYKDIKASLTIPPDLFKHLGLMYPSGKLGVGLHRLVMETFKPLKTHYKEYEFPEFVMKMFDEMVANMSEPQLDYALSQIFVVDHIDCNPINNHISNLAWVSSADNQAHTKARRLGLTVNSDGVKLGNEQYYTSARSGGKTPVTHTQRSTLEDHFNG